MAHIAMVSIPAPGHVNPSLEIIRSWWPASTA
jgi:UDP:flavonoid glycosyltransferase YjiC (YdhE family)